jgi:hypothetical protein
MHFAHVLAVEQLAQLVALATLEQAYGLHDATATWRDRRWYSYTVEIHLPPSEWPMPAASALEAVHVPRRYPTALIFVDESSVKATAGKFFVVGAVKVRNPGQLLRAVKSIRDSYGYWDEFKFSKITRDRFPIFCELVDVLEQSDAHIGACIVDHSRGADPFGNGEPQWLAHARLTAQLLVGIINRRELASVMLDQVSTPKGCAFEDTVRNLVNARMRSTSLVTAACVDSRCSDGVQLADLVAGAVAHQCRQPGAPTSPKAKIAGRLAVAFGTQDLSDGRTDRVNVATFGVPTPRKRLRSVGANSSRAS